jgi:hypothetical protein
MALSTALRKSASRGQLARCRVNRTIKEATVNRYNYDNHEQLRRRFNDFNTAYKYGCRLETLKGITLAVLSANTGQISRSNSSKTRSIKCRD